MTNELHIEGSQNIGIQNVAEGASVKVTQILAKSFEYNDLLDRLKTKQELFDLVPEENIEKRLQLSAEINRLKETFEQFKRDVLALAETFSKIEINTDRLKRAKEFFDNSEIGEARIVLEIELEQMQDDQQRLLKEKEHYEKDILPNLINNSEEFLLLAMATQINYADPNRFSNTCKYFETSIRSHPNKINVFNYAIFLQDHNQHKEAEKYYSQFLDDFSSQMSTGEYATVLNNLATLHKDQNNYDEALKGYKEALRIYRELAEMNPNVYLSYVAMILNNLAILHKNQNNYNEALKEYEEALAIRRQLTEANSSAYLRDIAMILNNLAVLHKAQNNYDEALKEYKEALKIGRQLAETNPNVYLPHVATTLNNLAVLHKAQNNYEEALKEYEEVLRIYRELAETNPNVYLSYVAGTLNNLANLHQDQNNYEEALKEYKEALEIGRQLAETNPNVYLPHVATTLNNFTSLLANQEKTDEALKRLEESTNIYRELVTKNFQTYFPNLARNLANLALFYQRELNQREKSIEYAIETMSILLPYLEKVPFTQEYYVLVWEILSDWGLSEEEISQMIEEKIKK